MRGARLTVCVLAGALWAGGAWSQDGNQDTFDTDLGALVIESLDGDNEGGLTLEQLQDLPDLGIQRELQDITTETREQVAAGSGAQLRALDKLDGTVRDLNIPTAGAVEFGRITVRLRDCRYPEGNPTGDAYAYLVIEALGAQEPVFEGWMIASSPALNALDHPRYDVWVLSCSTS